MDWKRLREGLLGEFRASELPKWLSVPVFPIAASRFLEASNDPDVDIEALAEIIDVDAGLTSALLRYVNNGVNGLRFRANSTRRAIGLLGIQRSRMVVLGVAAERSFTTPSFEGFDERTFLRRNMQRALFAQALAVSLRHDADVAFTAALLADSTLPLLAARSPRLYRSIHAADGLSQSLDRYEQGMFGYNHAYTAAKIFQGWGFPDELVCCVALHHEPLKRLLEVGANGTAVVAVRLASDLPDWFRQEPNGLPRLIEFVERIPGLELPAVVAQVDAVVSGLDPEWDRSDALENVLLAVA